MDPESWPQDLVLGATGGLALVGLWRGMRRFFPTARELERKIAELLGPLQTSEAMALALLSGFAEELFFRGAVQGAWGWPLATLVFALLHTGPGPAFRAWTGFAAGAGLLLAGLAEWSGSLLAPIVAHVLVNAVNLLRLRELTGRR
ncbi:MAG: CPBP family intramembrane glutamic endopeptidase [Thermoanaerobaculia bacterium]|nr:CPBP family intramembrane glutamic endopeptidase [Thermoanaerobaculia bacterium]